MSMSIFSIMLGSAALLSPSASGQDASFYDCQNNRMPIVIAAMPLDKALTTFTRITRCPVSVDTDQGKGRPTRSMKTTRISKTLTNIERREVTMIGW